jgi:adenylyltransferase/sulfurtransferase
MQLTKDSFFKRQTTLTEIGEKGQQLLQQARVLVIGCGGLGNPAALYLATSGVGHLHLVDFDTVSVSNLHRQVAFTTNDVDLPKAEVLAREIKLRAPFTKVTFSNKAVSKNNILDLIARFDVVVDGTDSLPVKYMINDACVIQEKPLAYGSLYKFDGYVALFNVKNELGALSCNLRDAFPEIATDIPNCEEAGTLNPIVGIIGLLQANEVIKLITKTGKLLSNQLLIYNALENSQLKIKLRKNIKVNAAALFSELDYTETFCETQQAQLLITASVFKQKLGKDTIEVVSVLNHNDMELPFTVHQNLPYKTFDSKKFKPNYNKEYVVICKKGITSYDVVLKLKEQFPKLKVYSLKGGLANFY